jgi:hypothetical protein
MVRYSETNLLVISFIAKLYVSGLTSPYLKILGVVEGEESIHESAELI